MEWKISNKKEKTRLAVIVALVTFSTVFLLTGFIMTQVYGLKPGDPDFTLYLDQYKNPKTPYDNFLTNGCLTKGWDYPNDKTVILDTKGLEELGLLYYDPNTCFDIAKQTPGYTIDKIETYKSPSGPFGIEKEQMKITLTKK